MSTKGECRKFGVAALADGVVDECFAQGDIPIAALKTHRDIAVNLVGLVLEIAVIQHLGAGKDVKRLDLNVILSLGLDAIQLLGVLQVGATIHAPVVIEIMLVVHSVADARADKDVLARGLGSRGLILVFAVKGMVTAIVLSCSGQGRGSEQ